MKFIEYYLSMTKEERLLLARRAKTSIKQLQHIVNGERNVGMDLAKRLIKADENITAGMFL